MPNTKENTKCFTYKVEMVIQILAIDLPTASEKLNTVGGHVTNRTTELLHTTDLPNGLNKN